MPSLLLPRPRRAFTLVEVIVVIVVITILGLLAFPAIGGLREAAADRDAGARAQAINAAKQTFQLHSMNSSSAWSAAADDNARWALIRGSIPGAPASLSDYVPPGYAFSLGSALDQRVAITRTPNGPAIPY